MSTFLTLPKCLEGSNAEANATSAPYVVVRAIPKLSVPDSLRSDESAASGGLVGVFSRQGLGKRMDKYAACCEVSENGQDNRFYLD
jgi:hypothetical protein